MPDGLAITYMTDQLEFSGAENGIQPLIMLLCVVTVVLHFLLFGSFPHPPIICFFSQRTRRATIGLLLSTIQPDSKFHDGSHYLDAQYRLCLYLP
jgi:hypothetical protein